MNKRKAENTTSLANAGSFSNFQFHLGESLYEGIAEVIDVDFPGLLFETFTFSIVIFLGGLI